MRGGGQKSSVLKVSPSSHPLRPLWQGTGVKTCMCESCHILVNLLTGFHPSTLNEGIDFVILFCFPTPWKSNILLHLKTALRLLLYAWTGFILVQSFLFILYNLSLYIYFLQPLPCWYPHCCIKEFFLKKAFRLTQAWKINEHVISNRDSWRFMNVYFFTPLPKCWSFRRGDVNEWMKRKWK